MDYEKIHKKNLKDRVQQKQEWSEEDERHLNSIIKRTVAYGDSSIYGLIKDDIDWLKYLKDRVQPQRKQWWNEEDCLQLDAAINIVANSGHTCTSDWLKSIKDRVQPQPKYECSEDIPYWKKSTLPNDNVTGFNSDFFSYNGYCINYKELFDKLPKED